MKESAPKSLAAGFQLLVKIFQPSVENHDEACWLVETAIQTRITSTSRPDASARIAKARSPRGRCCYRGSVDPAGTAGSTWVIVLTTASPSDEPASRQPSLAGDLAQLRLRLLLKAGGQRRVSQVT